MERLTYDFAANGQHCWQVKGADNALCKEVCRDQGDNGCKDCPIAKAFDRLAAYEDAGLEPEEIAVVKNIVGRLATADYPHNFQRERSDIATYMYWITSVMKEAKEWWNGRIKARDEAEKALEGINNG